MQKPTNKQEIAQSPAGALTVKRPREYMSDDDARLLVTMRNSADRPPLRWLASKFEVSLTCVARIVRGERRSSATGITQARARDW